MFRPACCTTRTNAEAQRTLARLTTPERTMPRRLQYTPRTMRQRWAFTLVLVTALLFTGVGVAIDRWVVPEKGSSAECVILRQDVQRLTYSGGGSDSLSQRDRNQSIVDRYNDECR